MRIAASSKVTPPLVSGRLPIIGHFVQFTRDRAGLLRRGFAEHGSVFAIDLFGQKVAFVTGAEHNRTVYSRTDQELNIAKAYASVAAAFGEVLFLADRDTYNNQRPLINDIFRNERMPGYIAAMNAESRRWLDSLDDSAEIEISAEMVALTRYVAGHAFIGPTFRDELGETFWGDYDAMARSIDFVFPPQLPLPKFIRRDRAKRRLRRRVLALIERRRSVRAPTEDLITRLMETPQQDGSKLSESTLADMLVGLLFAGHETTAGQAAWTLIALARHPEAFARVRAEVETHVGAGLPIDGSTLRKLELTYAAIDETTRLYPSAEQQLRNVDKELSFGVYTVPAGWQVCVNGTNSHHLTSEFHRPERFDLERSARGEGKTPYLNVGFGGGRHKCPGMNFGRNEIAVIVAHVLQQFDVELLTHDTRVLYGSGANHPSATRMRFRRRARVQEQRPTSELTAVRARCERAG